MLDSVFFQINTFGTCINLQTIAVCNLSEILCNVFLLLYWERLQ